MNHDRRLSIELLVMDLAEEAGCKTAKDYEEFAEELHESVENAIQDMCMDYGVEDYMPSY